MNLHTEWPGEAALLRHYDEVRARLRTPPNAVQDTGINLVNGRPERTTTLEPPPPRRMLEPELPPQRTPEYLQKVTQYRDTYRTSFLRKSDSITIRTAINFVAKELELSRDAVLSRGRTRDLVLARQIAVHLTAKHTTYSMCSVAHYLGIDHTTVLSGKQTIAKIMAKGGPEAEKIHDIEANLLKAFPRAAFSSFHKPLVAQRSGQDLQIP